MSHLIFRYLFSYSFLIFDVFSFQGAHCEICKPGFYGDECKPCECPYTDPGNNFADTCSINVNTSLVECQCEPGYKGVRCDQCADGYYGKPLELGGSCKRCLCNGNIDTRFTGMIIMNRGVFAKIVSAAISR